MTAHWGLEDPAAVDGPEIQKEAAVVAAFRYMKNRISAFTSLPVASLDKASRRTKLTEIGQSDGAPSPRNSAARGKPWMSSSITTRIAGLRATHWRCSAIRA